MKVALALLLSLFVVGCMNLPEHQHPHGHPDICSDCAPSDHEHEYDDDYGEYGKLN